MANVNFLTDNQGNPSSIRVLSFLAFLVAGYFGFLTVTNSQKSNNTKDIPTSDVQITIAFLIAAFAPKALQKFAEIEGEKKQ